jgi:hypothetical protein
MMKAELRDGASPSSVGMRLILVSWTPSSSQTGCNISKIMCEVLRKSLAYYYWTVRHRLFLSLQSTFTGNIISICCPCHLTVATKPSPLTDLSLDLSRLSVLMNVISGWLITQVVQLQFIKWLLFSQRPK